MKIRLDAGQPGRRRKRVDTHTHTRPGWPVEKGPCAESRKVEWAKVMWDAYYTKNVKFDKTCFFVFFFCFRCCSLFFQYLFLLDDFFFSSFSFFQIRKPVNLYTWIQISGAGLARFFLTVGVFSPSLVSPLYPSPAMSLTSWKWERDRSQNLYGFGG